MAQPSTSVLISEWVGADGVVYPYALSRTRNVTGALLGTINPAFTQELDQLVDEIVGRSPAVDGLELSTLRQLALRSAGPMGATEVQP